MKKQKVLEKDIQNGICEYLDILMKQNKLMFWRQNTVPVFDRSRNSFRRQPKYSLNGVSDIIVVVYGKVIFIEVKRPGGKQSPAQKEFEKLCFENNATYFVATSLEEVISNLKLFVI